jgi:hypothetical protein
MSIPLTDTDFMQDLTFNLFNPLLGTLNEICFTLEGEISSQLTDTNLAPSQNTVTFTLDALIKLLRPDASEITNVPLALMVSVLLEPMGEMGDTFSTMIGLVNPSMVTSPPPASDLALFTAPGTIDLTVMASALGSIEDTAGNEEGSILTQAAATVTLEYKYDPVAQGPVVPEPSSVVLLGVGAAGLVAVRWSRKRRVVC